MAENRRSLNLWDSSGESAARDYDRVSRAMEEQLRIQNEIASAERERQQALEKTREQQELISRDASTGFEQMSAGSEKFIASTTSGFKSLFRDVFKGELSSAKDLWDAFCGLLANSFSNSVSKMISSGLDHLLGNLFGSSAGDGGGLSGLFAGLFHSGGVAGEPTSLQMISPLAFAGAPRLHSGLASDEFAAILQKGELVVPRGKWSTGGQTPSLNVVFNVENQTGVNAEYKQKSAGFDGEKYVIGIVAKNINENGVLGQMVQSRSGKKLN